MELMNMELMSHLMMTICRNKLRYLKPVLHFTISLAASEIFPQCHHFFQLSTDENGKKLSHRQNVSLAASEMENGLKGWFPLRKIFLRTGTDRKVSFVLRALGRN